ncbi:aminotransferase class V-fold PLP-dependent enzyme [Candidatus Viadribacter manganicus]|uniref:Sphingosine-1-phosphate lyase n=1 Tax=Candidatus Viadribacter manganicus TaxID=1759059 RepID=A0A1B1AM84_9PROT|nr:aspartate aminotransferase family protein [Candidatus Viadribacter manganicus]ANP47682.1 sphingosine-1-phosphate lyase [Candidatus Viadribacter manganicus]
MSSALPERGAPWSELEPRMRELAKGDVKWRDGRTGMYIFNAGEDVARVKKEAYAMFCEENGLGPAAFPSLAQMEREVVAAGISLLNAPPGAAGAMSSGGTDSIFLAVKTARDHARAKRGLTGALNIVAPASAHPAFDKACMTMDIEMRRIPTKDYLADVAAMESAIDANTLMIVGSAPCFPYGLIDPIEALGELAERKRVWLHVDACVGAYIAPFVRMNGVDLPAFDFSVPGVWSISGDLHKYGYASKGASTVFFRSEALKDFMQFDAGPWPLGRMITPTLAGTRPGGAIAAAWAVMNFLGVEGYKRKQGEVTQAREKIEAGVRKLGFSVLGKPQLGIVSFAHPEIDALRIYAQMHKRGWFTAALVDPRALHLMLSPKHNEVAHEYLADLEASVGAVTEEQFAPKYAG